ncbi:neuronal acetylcholine receptor subunit alpha-10 isoform X1 [Anser cygnoides]|uniref:neuronal acetylcholine receptor subunit alpha-10 isoform X1 n=1 Tax=Anser cygnoides TaxID=8845 RepID=UPI0034D1A720
MEPGARLPGWLLALGLASTVLAPGCGGAQGRLAHKLLHDLFANYSSALRPAEDTDRALNVTLQVTLSQIIDMDERNQVLTSYLWVRQAWLDAHLTWDKDAYGGIDSIRIPSSYVWRPDIVLYNKWVALAPAAPRPGGAAGGHRKLGAGGRGPSGLEAVILAGLGGLRGHQQVWDHTKGQGHPGRAGGCWGGAVWGSHTSPSPQPCAPLGLSTTAAAPRPPLPQRRRPVQRLDGDQRGAALRRAHHVGLARHHQELLQGGRLLLPLRRAAVPPHLRLLDLQREPDRPPQPAGRGRPDGLRGERGVGGAGHAGHEERRHLRVLLGALPRRHLHAAAQAARLLLHLQPAPALRHDLLPGAPGLLPPGRLGGEGLAGGDGAAGPHRLPAAGGREHAAVGERAAHREVLHRHHDHDRRLHRADHLHHERPPLRAGGQAGAAVGTAPHPAPPGPRPLRLRGWRELQQPPAGGHGWNGAAGAPWGGRPAGAVSPQPLPLPPPRAAEQRGLHRRLLPTPPSRPAPCRGVEEGGQGDGSLLHVGLLHHGLPHERAGHRQSRLTAPPHTPPRVSRGWLIPGMVGGSGAGTAGTVVTDGGSRSAGEVLGAPPPPMPGG